MRLGELATQTSCAIDHAVCHLTPSRESKFIQIAKKVALVSVALLAAVVAPVYFMPFFAAGVAWGFYVTFNHKPVHYTDTRSPGCTQSYYEDLTEMPFPRGIAFAYATAIAVHHLMECPVVFGAMAGTAFGQWAGRELAIIFDRYHQSGLFV